MNDNTTASPAHELAHQTGGTAAASGSREADAACAEAATDDSEPGPEPGPEPEPEQPPPAAPLIEIIEIIEFIDSSRTPVETGWIELRLRAAIEHVGRPVSRVGISMIDDERMTALHTAHCNDPTTTDVLTFPLSGDGEPIDVDITICVDEAARQITGRGHRLEAELLLYCLHGVLHCAGYDDHSEEASRQMHVREDEILQSIGVGPIFHERGPGHDGASTSASSSGPRDGGNDGR